MRTFSKVHVYDKIEETPAAVDTSTGALYVSKADMDRMDAHEKTYVLYHELGHLNGKRTEKGADRYALEKMKANGYSMTDGVKALSSELSMKNSSHRNRVVAAFKYAQRHGKQRDMNLNKFL